MKKDGRTGQGVSIHTALHHMQEYRLVQINLNVDNPNFLVNFKVP